MKYSGYLAIGCCLTSWAASVGFAASLSEFTFSVTPNSVALTRDEEASALVLLQNTGTSKLEGVHISSFSNPPMNIKIDPTENRVVPPKGTAAWKVGITRAPSSEQAGTVFFRVDFTQSPPLGEGAAFSTTAVTSLNVTTQPPQKVEELLDVKCETVMESLNEKRPGVIYLRLKSQTNVPLDVGPITISKPVSVDITNVSGVSAPPPATSNSAPTATPAPSPAPTRITIDAAKVSLQPFETRVLGFTFEAQKRVTPGKHTIVFEVPAAWENEGKPLKAYETVTQSIDVGIFGETAILAAIGIPTFLFLPGFLVVMTFAGLWKLGNAKAGRGEFPLKVTTPEFYVVAITISILAFWIYAGQTGRDFTASYGLTDVVYLWMGSIIVGATSFGAFVIGERGVRKLRDLWQERVAFAASDNELQFLKKLGRLKLGLRFDRFSRTEGSTITQGFVIATSSTDPTKSWVAPEIEMQWNDPSDKDKDAAVGAIDANDASAAVKVLKRAIANKQVSLQWRPNGTLKRLQLLENVAATIAADKILVSG